MNYPELRKKVAEAIMASDEPKEYEDFSWNEARAAMEVIADWIEDIDEVNEDRLRNVVGDVIKSLRGYMGEEYGSRTD